MGGAGSLDDLPTACMLLKVPSQSSLNADSDSDILASTNRSPPQKGPELTGGKMSTDSDPLSDDSTLIQPTSAGKKTVAINTSQVEHFTHRLLPVQSPEFDNVMDQVKK